MFEDWDGYVVSQSGSVYVFCENCSAIRLAGADVLPPHCGICQSGAVRECTLDDLRRELFHLSDATPNLDWLLLTKRPENVPGMWSTTNTRADGVPKDCRRNVWLGTSVSDQQTADKLIPELFKCRDLSRVLFVSAEPLLRPIDFTRVMFPQHEISNNVLDCQIRNVAMRAWIEKVAGLDWVIVGGESGPHARPMHPDWALSIRDQCQVARVPFFFKQWGEYLPESQDNHIPDGTVANLNFARDEDDLEPVFRVGKQAAGRLLDGREWNEIPE